jgi:hypothetical protein
MTLANTRNCRVSVACLTAMLVLISVPVESVSAQSADDFTPAFSPAL